MGFLMGAYGKLMAGKLVRDIQFQMLGIQSQLRRVTREIGDKTKYYESMQRNQKTQMQAQMQYGMFGVASYLDMPYGGAMCGNMGLYGNQLMAQAMQGGLDQNKYMIYSSISQQMQMQFTQAQAMWDDMFEMQKQADLQALKDLADALQMENDNLKSRLEIAQNEYKAFQEEEKAGAKNIVPEYTPQG